VTQLCGRSRTTRLSIRLLLGDDAAKPARRSAAQSAKKAAQMKAAELFDLSGQVALVTGASSGLGWRFAQVLAANGAAAVLVARRVDRLAELKMMIDYEGGRAIAVEADVLDRDAMTRAFDMAEQAFGTVTILVNNAGVAHADHALKITEAEWRRVLATDLDAVLFWAQEAARRMLAAKKRGAIVNVASILGLAVSKGTIAYATAKAGVIQLTKSLALELAFKGVRVNAIAPGFIMTELNRQYLEATGAKMTREIPAGRFGEEQDLDGALLLLVSAAGSYMAGTTLVVDGGHMLALRGT
jgi:3-oxoacyl-[acyl-carrier protein] reductase